VCNKISIELVTKEGKYIKTCHVKQEKLAKFYSIISPITHNGTQL